LRNASEKLSKEIERRKVVTKINNKRLELLCDPMKEKNMPRMEKPPETKVPFCVIVNVYDCSRVIFGWKN